MFVQALIDIGLLLVGAKLAEGFLGRFGLNPLIAYVLAGVVLGPLTGVVELISDIDFFVGIGVLFLFFLIGIDEIDIPGFLSTVSGRYFVAGTLSAVVSALIILPITWNSFSFSLNLEFSKALALAGILSLSSVGIVAKVLADKGYLKNLLGLRMFTVVIIAEVIAMLVVGFTIGEAGAHPSVTGILILLGKIVGFVVVAWLLSAKVLPPLIIAIQRFLKASEIAFALLIGGLFLMVAVGEQVGLHGSLAALLFGAAMSGMPHRVRETIMPGIRSASNGIFVPVFFASAGLYLDLDFTHVPVATIIALALVPAIGNLLGAFIGAYAARLDAPAVMATGLMAKGVGEIAFLILLLREGIIHHNVFSLLLLIMFGYILTMPQIISFAVGRARHPSSRSPRPEPVTPAFARHALEGVEVGVVIDRDRKYPAPSTTLREFASHWLVTRQNHYLVVDEGRPVGVVSGVKMRFMQRVFPNRSTIGGIMRTRFPQAWSDEPIDDVLERMTDHQLTVIPVMDRETGAFLGSVTNYDIMDLIMLTEEIREELEQRSKDAPAE